MPDQRPPALRGSIRLLPVAQTRLYAGTTITLIALEVYADGFLADFRLLLGSSRLANPQLLVRCRDDRGGHYQAWKKRRRGGRAPRHERWSLTYRFAPALDPRARELQVTVMEVWSWGRKASRPGPWAFTVAL